MLSTNLFVWLLLVVSCRSTLARKHFLQSSSPATQSSNDRPQQQPQDSLHPRGGGRLALLKTREKHHHKHNNKKKTNPLQKQPQPLQSTTSSFQARQLTQVTTPSSSATTPSTTTNGSIRHQKALQIGLVSAATAALIGVAFAHRAAWLPYVTNKERLQTAVVNLLQGLRPDDPHDLGQRLQAYATYTLGMTLWEAIGLSTIPVETAAGMVFGWSGGLASASGKLLGASLAFGLGKLQLQQFVEHRLRDNATCRLLRQHSADRHHPLLSALLMKFSCFPETIKNFGTAAFLPSVHFGHFFLATALHGCTFTALWTWLGVETSQQLEQQSSSSTSATSAAASASNSWGLQLALAGMLFMGFVLSPLSMAWWVRDLQKGEAEADADAKKVAKNNNNKRR